MDSPASCAPDAAGSSLRALDIAQEAGARGLRVLLALQVLRTVLRLGFLALAAITVGRLVMNEPISLPVVGAAATMLAMSLAVGFAADRSQALTEARVSIAVRGAAARRLDEMQARQVQSLPVGGLIVAVQRYPESVASLAIGHRVATIMMAAGPLLATAVLILVSWQATLLVVGLTPVMIVFFALVGGEIRRRADIQERSFGRLAGQFADRIRTLPTILANHALGQEKEKLAGRLETYAHNTMGVLRIAFVNAGIIDFFASMSIAVLAVFLGLGHLKLASIPGFSNLELWQSLFVLMIAPDYFAPFRRFSEQYHAKAEGLAAAAALDKLLAMREMSSPRLPVAERVPLHLPKNGLVAIVGPSGSGKSTLLRRIAGIEPGSVDSGAAGQAIVWIATDSHVPPGTLGQAIAWEAGPVTPDSLHKAAAAVGLLDDALLPGGLERPLQAGGADLSGGQRLRLAVARAMLTDRIVLADEPTAKLDWHTAALVRRVLAGMATSRLVVVATHDRQLAAAADQIVDLSGQQFVEAAA